MASACPAPIKGLREHVQQHSYTPKSPEPGQPSPVSSIVGASREDVLGTTCRFVAEASTMSSSSASRPRFVPATWTISIVGNSTLPRGCSTPPQALCTSVYQERSLASGVHGFTLHAQGRPRVRPQVLLCSRDCQRRLPPEREATVAGSQTASRPWACYLGVMLNVTLAARLEGRAARRNAGGRFVPLCAIQPRTDSEASTSSSGKLPNSKRQAWQPGTTSIHAGAHEHGRGRGGLLSLPEQECVEGSLC